MKRISFVILLSILVFVPFIIFSKKQPFSYPKEMKVELYTYNTDMSYEINGSYIHRIIDFLNELEYIPLSKSNIDLNDSSRLNIYFDGKNVSFLKLDEFEMISIDDEKFELKEGVYDLILNLLLNYKQTYIHEYIGFVTGVNVINDLYYVTIVPTIADGDLRIPRGGIYLSDIKAFGVKENNIIRFKIYNENEDIEFGSKLLEVVPLQEGIKGYLDESVCYLRWANLPMNVTINKINDSIEVKWDKPICNEYLQYGTIDLTYNDIKSGAVYTNAVDFDKDTDRVVFSELIEPKSNNLISLINDVNYIIEIQYHYKFKQEFDFSERAVQFYYE